MYKNTVQLGLVIEDHGMEGSIARLPDYQPLQLDYFQSGALCRDLEGSRHRKTTPYCILIHVLHGAYRIQSCGQDVLLRPGQVALVPANREVLFVHHNGVKGYIHSQWLHFRFSYAGLVDFLSLYECQLLMSGNIAGELCAELIRLREVERTDVLAFTSNFRTAGRILDLLCRASHADVERIRSYSDPRLLKVIQLMRSRLTVGLDVETMAREAGLSPSRFQVLFKKKLGTPPMRYLGHLRLEVAGRMLAGSNATLAEIADQTGFSDAFHLSRQFKSRFGVPPREFRAASRQKLP